MDHTQAQERFSDYWEKTLDEATRRQVEEHLSGCEACRREYAEFERAMAPLPRLHRMAAPEQIKQNVPDLIHKRSRGRFFGVRPLSDRLPLEWLSLIMLGLVAAAYLLVKLAYPAVRAG